MAHIVERVRRAGGELRLSATGGLVGRGIPSDLAPLVRAARDSILAALKRQQELREAGVDTEGIAAVEDLLDIFDGHVTAVGPAPEPEPIRLKQHRQPRLLEPGEEVRLTGGGPWWRVDRVTQAAAYLRRVNSGPTQTRLLEGAAKPQKRGMTIQVAPTSFVVERR